MTVNLDPTATGSPSLQLRVRFADGSWIGPGKADLMQLIQETGSISAAGRRMGMSYKRAWTLVGTMNAMFHAPLVDSARGGAQGGGASLTPLGLDILARFRRIQSAAQRAAQADMQVMEEHRSDIAEEK